MVYSLADNIISPLGMTTQDNYQALKAGRSALRRYEGALGVPEPFTASLFSEEQRRALSHEGLTRFESLVVASIRDALVQTDLDVSQPRVVFILSTTKGNIELLSRGIQSPSDISPATAAQHIADAIGVSTTPLVVCNACISGVAALILASRLLEAGYYDVAIVCGADVQNTFTVSGFQSLKAVSEDACRPFDLERTGLNLGEAAATLILGRQPKKAGCWAIEAGAIRNDGFHISSPSKNGDGARAALQAIGAEAVADTLAFVNAHGTATMFNDQMESVAIAQSGLQTVPVNALKGFYGHTLGAAGLLETVASMAAADDGTILATRGFQELGVSGRIQVAQENGATRKRRFIKMISGFGGGNAAILCERGPLACEGEVMRERSGCAMQATHRVCLTPQALTIDGKEVATACPLTDLYKRYVGDYPKYYKMDGLSRLGFLASELLLQAEGRAEADEMAANRAVILFNHASSIDADVKFQASIADPDNFFASPSVFVYTLPNIVTGEIAIRHHYHGETSFYVLPARDEQRMQQVITASFQDAATRSMITGWVDYVDEQHYEASLQLILCQPDQPSHSV